MTQLRSLLFLFLALGLAAAPTAAQTPGAERGQEENVVYDPALYEGMTYRMIGPTRGGRVTTVDGVPGRPHTFYMGTVGGGVWKTTTAGENWSNITGGALRAGAIGAVAVAPSDRNVIWVGTGSGGVRGNVSPGRGVYRSTDGGDTWTYLGLPESGHVHKIAVHPDDPDVAYVAALGHIFGPNEARGVYKTTDGGQTWDKVLYVSPNTGAIEVKMNPDNPRILYAAAWKAERKPWAMFSGADKGGIYKSTDSGETWTKLTEGLPSKVGRIGMAVSPADPDRLYALVESTRDSTGLYRSDDAGRSWTLVNTNRNLTARPWYYMHVTAAPHDVNELYVSGEGFYGSVDGGESFRAIDIPHGDHHDLWINPNRPDIWVQGNDGGATVTLDGGKTWSTQHNQPTAEFYSVTVDDRFPYWVYAPQQDNSTLALPSARTDGLARESNWVDAGGCETGPVAVDPQNPNITYSGCKGRVSRLNRETDQERAIWTYPLEYHGRSNQELKHRRQWTSQIEFSPHNPDRLYHTSQYVHLTTDEGQTWTRISPDLTRWTEHRDLHETPPGGPLTYDQTGVEIYGTIVAFEESPHREGVYWAGSDDGAVHVSRDGGQSWQDVTPEGMQLHSTVAEIVPSPREAGRAYMAVHRYRMDDMKPYIYRTNNYGENWTLLTGGENGLPADYPVRSISVDPKREGLLYAGTEYGLFVSFDDGAHWQSLQQNLPVTPVMDMEVKRNDLVVATQGRSLWIMDDLSPLRQIADSIQQKPAHLFEPTDAHRVRMGEAPGPAENPPEGAIFYYHLSEDRSQEVTLTVRDESGTVAQTFSTQPTEDESTLPTGPGTHRVHWDLRYPGAYIAPGVHEVPAPEQERARIQTYDGYVGGPLAVPGTYRVQLTVGDRTETHRFEVKKDPRLGDEVTAQDMRADFRFGLKIRDKISEIQRAVDDANRVLDALETVEAQAEDPEIKARARTLNARIDSVAGELYKHEKRGDHAHLHPELTTSYARIALMLISSDHGPAASARRRFEDLEPQFDRHMSRLRALLETDVPSFNQQLRNHGVRTVPTPAATE
ncbi:MAG: WD40/YVTN/BNR-like repeat-containing protein [Salinibacter sp.]